MLHKLLAIIDNRVLKWTRGLQHTKQKYEILDSRLWKKGIFIFWFVELCRLVFQVITYVSNWFMLIALWHSVRDTCWKVQPLQETERMSPHRNICCNCITSRSKCKVSQSVFFTNVSIISTISMINSRGMSWESHVACMEMRNSYRILVGICERKRPFGISKSRW